MRWRNTNCGSKQFGDVATCRKRLPVVVSSLPDYRLSSEETCGGNLCYEYYSGVDALYAVMQHTWQQMKYI